MATNLSKRLERLESKLRPEPTEPPIRCLVPTEGGTWRDVRTGEILDNEPPTRGAVVVNVGIDLELL